MYVDREFNLDHKETNLSKLDLKYLERHLTVLMKELQELNTLSSDASKEALAHYTKVLNILDDKIEYIIDTADIYNYVNSYFDLQTVKDLYNFNIKEAVSDSGIFDPNQKGLSLKSVNSLYNCSKTINNSTITFYNTNTSSHTGIHITSPFLDLITISNIVLRKADGTIRELEINVINDQGYYINHETLVSSQIDISFKPIEGTTDLLTYLETVNLNLIDYSYQTEGYVPMKECTLTSSDLFTIITNTVIPKNTYANLDLGVELIDINGNVLDIIETTIPLNNVIVCKRLDRVNFNEVDKIVALFVSNKKTNSELSREYLESLDLKNQKYILYTVKDLLENTLNNYIKKLGTTSFKVNTKVVKQIRFSPTVEMYSFQQGVSPIIKHVTGVTKNDTI